MALRRNTCVLLCAVAASSAARAGEAIYGPDGAPTVVQHKLHTMTGLWEAGLAFDMAMNTALVDQMGGLVSVSYHPNEWLDLGLDGLLHHTALSTLALNVRTDLRSRAAAQRGDELTGDNQLRGGIFALARVAPVYGKFSLAGETNVHFQAYLFGGGGAARIHRESINLCADPGTATCGSFQQTDWTRPAAIGGAGFRFYFNRAFSLRTEVRGYFFRSSYRSAADPTQPGSGTEQGYLASIATFNAGFSVLF